MKKKVYLIKMLCMQLIIAALLFNIDSVVASSAVGSCEDYLDRADVQIDGFELDWINTLRNFGKSSIDLAFSATDSATAGAFSTAFSFIYTTAIINMGSSSEEFDPDLVGCIGQLSERISTLEDHVFSDNAFSYLERLGQIDLLGISEYKDFALDLQIRAKDIAHDAVSGLQSVNTPENLDQVMSNIDLAFNANTMALASLMEFDASCFQKGVSWVNTSDDELPDFQDWINNSVSYNNDIDDSCVPGKVAANFIQELIVPYSEGTSNKFRELLHMLALNITYSTELGTIEVSPSISESELMTQRTSLIKCNKFGGFSTNQVDFEDEYTGTSYHFNRYQNPNASSMMNSYENCQALREAYIDILVNDGTKQTITFQTYDHYIDSRKETDTIDVPAGAIKPYLEEISVLSSLWDYSSLVISKNDAVPITVNDVVGQYNRQPVENSWHTGTISISGSNCKWTNQAGRSWTLIPDLDNGQFLTTSDCPYGSGKTFALKLNSSGAVAGFVFQTELYSRE